MAGAIDILHLFPQLTAIGQQKLQVYCDEWLQRPIAREYGIVQIAIDEQLALSVNLDAERAEFVGDSVFIPIDELLGYIIDHHFAETAERQRLHAGVRDAKKRWAELNRDYEATIGRVGTLYLICKNCGAALETQHKAVEGQVIECPPCKVTCPACGRSHIYDGSDLRLKLSGA